MPDHDMAYVQPPVMTQRHVDAIWQCYRLFCFPGFADQQTLLEIWQHLTALIAQPVPSREAADALPHLVWTDQHPELRGWFGGSISVPGPIVTTITVETYDLDGTPVTYEGEVTKRPGHDERTISTWPDEDDEEDEDEEDESVPPPTVNPKRIAADGTLRYRGEHQPAQNTSSHPDWRQEFKPPTAEDCYLDCDQ